MSQAHGVGPNSLPVLHSDGLKMKALSESCKQDQRLGTPMQYLAVWLFLMSPLLHAQSLQDSDLDGTSDDIEAADPELNPYDPDIFLPRLLKYFSFDNLEEGPSQIVDPNRLREGHQFSAIHFGKGQEPGLELPLVEKDALTFNPPRQGTIRFWYQPTWTSLALLGEGPQQFGHFLEWVLPESTSSSRRWSLQVNPFMDLVQLQYQGSQSANENWLLNAPIAFEAGAWYQIALTYDAEWIQIHIDGELRASQLNPGFLAPDSGFAQGKLWIGNSAAGDRSVQGNIDDMEVFNFAMSPSQLISDLETMSQDSDQDGILDYAESAYYQTDPLAYDTDGDGVGDRDELLAGTSPKIMTDFPEQRIFYLDFDRGTFLTENNQLPLQHEQIDWIRSWHGAAGRFTSSLGSQLRYAYRQDNQALNIRLQAGSLRCWLKPQWDPLNPPRGVGRLIELGTWDPQGALGWWALQFNHDRERFQFITQAAGGSVYQFDAPIDLSSEEWYQFTVTWNALESRFYLNGSQKGRGPGISNYPDEATANASGLRIGSALHGNLSAEVILDDLEIFNHALDPEEILSNFQATRPDEDGDGIISRDEGFLLLDPLDPDTDYDGVSDGQELKEGTNPVVNSDGLPRTLATFTFDNPQLQEAGNQVPRWEGSLEQVVGWRGYGLHIHGNGFKDFSYAEASTEPIFNINLRKGTIVFWFKPDWDSGEGPSEERPILAMGYRSDLLPNAWWDLHFDEGGSRLRLAFEANGRSFVSLDHPIQWAAQQWHQIVLSYDIHDTTLWIDGEQVGRGIGIKEYPGHEARLASGLMVGMHPYTPSTLRGVLDELATYNYRWTPEAIMAAYSPTPPDSDQDGLSDQEELSVYLTNYLDADTDQDGITDGQEILNGTDPINETVFNHRKLAHLAFENENMETLLGHKPLWMRSARQKYSFDAGMGYQSSQGSQLIYRVREPDGHLNLNLREGSIKFWFKPNWTSGSRGHPFGSRLLEVGNLEDGNGWWGLFFNQDRTSLSLGSQGPGMTHWIKHLEANNLQLEKDQWYEIELSYGPKTVYAYNVNHPSKAQEFHNTHLYINGQRRAQGAGIAPTSLPNRQAERGGFAIGSAMDGSLSCDGVLDELETFNYARNIWSATTLPDNAWAARVDQNRSVIELSRRYQVSPHGLPPVDIDRRVLGESQWTRLISNYQESSYTDRTIHVGSIYEYQFHQPDQPELEVYQNRMTVASGLPPIHQRGHLILIREEGVAENMEEEMQQFRQDLEGDGWALIEVLAARHDEEDWESNRVEIERIKQRIHSIVNRFPPGYPMVIQILGHVPVPRSGHQAFDGHTEPKGSLTDHSGAWACDAYYGSLDEGYWKDEVETSHGAVSLLENLALDGKWDADRLPRSMELPVGRIDFWGLDSFMTADFLDLPDQDPITLERRLLRQYLRKNHAYRHGLTPVFEQICYFNGLDFARSSTGIFQALKLGASFYGLNEGKAIAGRPLYSKIPIQFGYHEMRAFPAGIQLGWNTRRSDLTYSHSTFDLLKLENEPKVLFHLMYGSWFGDWNLTRENWLRALLATPNYGLVSLYYPKFWDLEKMGLGAPFAVAFLEMSDLSDPFRDAPRMLSILGDSTLRLHVLNPVTELHGKRLNQGSQLSWDYPDPDAGFYIYRKDVMGTWQLLNQIALSDNLYDDTNAVLPASYMVRATKLQTSGSGSYNNLSQGIMIQIKD